MVDTGAHTPMGMARTTEFLCQGAASIAMGLAWICELQDIDKYFHDEQAKEQTVLGILGLLRELNFPLKIYQDQQRCSSSKSGGQEEMGLKLLRNAPRCVQNESAPGFLDRSKSI